MKKLPNAAPTFARIKLAAIAALFALPVLLATLLYETGWRPASSVNHGDLVQPARPIRDATLQSASGRSTALSELPEKWTMLYFAPSVCDATCEAVLYKMNQVQLTQGEHADRIQRVVIAVDATENPGLRQAVDRYPGAVLLTGSLATVRAFGEQFGGGGEIYLVDPLRNLMMSYRPGADPSGMRKDLARLLKVSRIG
jgi:cytochrome oxidase Cu insertion factor (SCO1/SenC/PrrC family)